MQYADSIADEYKVPTEEEIYSSLVGTVKSLKEQGYTRDEANDAAYKAFTTDEKGNDLGLPESQTDKIRKNIKDSLVEVYGRTFWQRILPGGR